MIETPFQIVTIKQPEYQNTTNSTHTYHLLLQNYCNHSYGLYTELFINKIVEQAQASHHFIYKFELKKNLRKCVKKFMLTDLELVFVGYYCQMVGWDIENQNIVREIEKEQELREEEVLEKYLELFLDFITFFVKSYIGIIEEFEAIEKFIHESFSQFHQAYQNWIIGQSKELFIITPRKINQIYYEFSRSCHIETSKKDYNNLVDTVIELSTSYSIIPNKKVFFKEKPNLEKKEYNRNAIIKNNSNINAISEGLEGTSSIAADNFGVENSRGQRKSSFMFESMQSLSRKSSQLIVENKKKSNIEIPAEPDFERSREKKPANKISLNFKSKEKPNSTVLGFIKEPLILQNKVSEKQKPNNRSIQNNQSKIDNNFSFINLRSNRSSRSNSQLPFLWMPSEDGFFDRSKLN